jgi:hypothetical protein
MTENEQKAQQEKALRPEDITRLFVEYANAKDAAGVASLYEEQAVMAYPPGGQTAGRDAIRAFWEQALPRMPHFAPEEPLPALVARRQPDGSWLRLLDAPEIGR